ncbi:MAG TPA: protein kinase [Isosphaeraceae bacterium]|jgi:hypothetical protein|nr:protein kinase [Isosphaeraceae bacterium]
MGQPAMTLSCSRCSRVLEYSGERPSFCAYCGQPLGDPRLEATVAHESGEATLDHDATRPAGPDRGDPEHVAGYRLIRPLGRGGMGTVYEAEDSHFGRRVALKLIARSHVASREAVERFRQEGRLASALTHPRCVFVLAADEEDDRPYIVMELMPGTTLTGLVKERGPLPIEEAVAKILDVIDGLRAAHRLGIVHRDVKPSNCFLDADGRVKVGDFGLSKSLAGDANLTRTGAFLGTPLYASPEQIRRDPIDARTDVYSVAATLFYLLTGRAPFQQDDAAAAMARIVSDPAPPVRTSRPEVPRSLDQVILKGLEREPSRRWRNLDEFRAALLPFLPGHHSIAGVGLRVGGMIIDLVPLAIVSIAIDLALSERWKWTEPLLDAVVWLLYFVPGEAALGRTLGKWLTRLRVISVPRNEPPGPLWALVRTAVFYGAVVLPFDVYADVLSVAPIDWHGRWWWAWLGPWGLLPIVGLAALASTMRARNGYRGLHELASGTRTVILPRAEHRREAPGRRPIGRDRGIIARPMGVLETVGPYKVRGAVRWEDGRKVLAAEDSSLGREVWVVLRPKGSPAPTAARRDLGRPARPRWLAGGEQGDRRWDAFVAPGGCPLADFAGLEGLSWSDARPILHDLADELAAACDDGTLPAGLSVDQVWVEPDGRVELVDPLGAEGGRPPEQPEQRRALELLLRAAALALEGGRRRVKDLPTAIKAAVPLHARRILDRLLGVGAPYATMAEVRADLDATRALPTELDLGPRLVRLAGFVLGVLTRFLLAALAVAIVESLQGKRSLLVYPPPPAPAKWVALACVLAWPLWAFLTRGGLAGRLTGMALVKTDGALPSRPRCAWREAVIWPPLLGLFAAFQALRALHPADGRAGLLVALAFFAWPIADAAHELAFPGRMIHDRLAGTTRVPR